MSGRPDYARQNGGRLSEAEARDWFATAATEARRAGCLLVRHAEHPTIPNLRLVEGWRWAADKGEPEWFLAK